MSNQCAACGGKMVYNPQLKALRCEQCGAVVQISNTVTSEKSLVALLKKAPEWKNDTVVSRCEHCGAKMVVAKADLIVKCEYCGAQNLAPTQDLPGIRPDTIAVFGIDQEEALSKARHWLSRRFFAPRRFYRNIDHTGWLRGVYFPAYTFDAQSSSSYRGLEIVTTTRTVVIDGKTTTQTQTHERPIFGQVMHQFDDVLISASETINKKTLQHLQPFATNEAQVYTKEFLLGYSTCPASMDALQCWHQAKNAMDQVIRRKIMAKYNNVVRDLQVETRLSNLTYKYVLLPLYVGHSEYAGSKYELYVNGQTGKVYGKTPKSPWKFLFLTALGALVAGGLIALAILL